MRSADLSPDRRACLEPVPEWPGAFALNPPAVRFDALAPLRPLFEAQAALERLRMASAQLPNPDLITRTLSRREAVMSSQIEGAHAGLQDVLEFEATQDAEGLPADARTTLNYVEALEFGLTTVRTHGQEAFSIAFVQALHRALMRHDSAYRDVPGEFRTVQNWIGGLRIQDARFVPPRPERIAGAMDDLVDRVLRYEPEGNAYLHVIVRAALAHAQFETIHPFRDGNGRTGRLLIPLMLAAEGSPPLYVSGPLYRNRHDYFDALLEVQLRSRWDSWIEFFTQAVMIACDESMALAVQLVALREDWNRRVAERRADSASRKLVAVLIGTPVVTVNQVKRLLGVSFPAANNAVADLVSLGILKGTPRLRNRVFVAHEAIAVLDQAPEELRRPSLTP
ncbi:Fic family protein [Aromatoleum evansii]|uniref:Fic family protein n=1 Tax=Aromatoleum evansii TaxID=59406 RepID=UPI00145EB025|nr:Fic family protein [Aromatoleum evansii]NMG29651.1 Fic family protein [Aromatoleum evansii]